MCARGYEDGHQICYPRGYEFEYMHYFTCGYENGHYNTLSTQRIPNTILKRHLKINVGSDSLVYPSVNVVECRDVQNPICLVLVLSHPYWYPTSSSVIIFKVMFI